MSASPRTENAAAPHRTLVVGAGLAGLLAARRHQARGAQVTVLEAEEEIGGAIAEATVGGIALNSGAEAYSCTSGAVDALLEEIGLGSDVVSPRDGLGSRLVSDSGVHRAPSGGLFGIPGRPLSAQTRAVIGWPGALRAQLDRVLPASVGLRPGVTLGEHVRTRMGRRVLERLVAPLVGGVHSADPDTVELTSVLPHLPAAVQEHGSLAAAVRALKPSAGRGGRSAGTAVHAVSPTMAALPRTLAEQLTAAGAEIRTSTPVTAIACAPSPRTDGTARWQVQVGGESLRADDLVLACPPDAVRRLLADADPDLAALLPEAPATAVRLVALVLQDRRLDAFPTGTGALVAPGSTRARAKAMTHASAKWEHVQRAAVAAHGPGTHVVRLSYGRPGEELPPDDSQGPDGTEGSIIDLALADASAILGVDLDRGALQAARVITWEQTMRRPGPGHREALAAITTALQTRPDLELVGSWRAGTGIDAIVRAHRTAEQQHDPTASGPPST